MKSTELLATTAIALGVGQLLMHMKDVYKNDDVSSYNFPSVFVGITASTLWLVYQVSNGANYSAVYTSIGLAAQLYILQRLLVKSKERTRKETHSKT